MPRRSIALFCGILLAHAALAGSIPADHEHIQYTGRIDFTQKRAPKISWPGTYIKVRFTGSSLKVVLTDEKGKNQFSVFIDGDYERQHVVRCRQGRSTYDVAEGLTRGDHAAQIFKRTEGGDGCTLFHGLVLDDGARLLPPDERPRLRIEIIGDSISCGLGNEAKNKKGEHDSAFKNNFLAYGAITARNLDAEYICTAKSGIGLIKSWFPITMPQYFYHLNANDETPGSRKWDFRKWQPHIVVINLFQNDSWIIKKAPDESARVAAYVHFVRTIRGHYPKAHIFCTLGTMSAGRSKWAGYVTTAAGMLNSAGDSKVYAHIFTGNTGSTHPKVNHHRQMANELTDLIKSKSIRGDEKVAASSVRPASGSPQTAGSGAATTAKESKEAERFYKMARQAEKMGQRQAAASFYARVVKEYPGTPFAARAREKLDKLGK